MRNKCSGYDTRPLCWLNSDYDYWKMYTHVISAKTHGKLIWKSIQNGPTPHPMITDPPPTDSTIVPAPRKKLDSEFSEEENKLEMADTQAEIILSQGFPEHLNNLNQQALQRRFRIMWRCSCKDQIYTHLKATKLCKKTLKKRSSLQVLFNTLAMLLTPHLLVLTTAQSFRNEALMATMDQIGRAPGVMTKESGLSVHSKIKRYDEAKEKRECVRCELSQRDAPGRTFRTSLMRLRLMKFDPRKLSGDQAEYEQCVLDNKNLTIEKKNLLIRNDCLIVECLEKDICSIVLTSDSVVPPSSNCLCEDLRSACDREHTKVLELEAEISKQKQLFIESEKRFAFLEQNYLRQQLQGKDDTIRNLDAQINIMKVLNVGTLKVVVTTGIESDRIQSKNQLLEPANISAKRAPRNHSSLPAKSANARRVEAHHRTLNKKNRVDSNLLIKHSVDLSVFNANPRKWKQLGSLETISKMLLNRKASVEATGRHLSFVWRKYPLTSNRQAGSTNGFLVLDSEAQDLDGDGAVLSTL
ncbi:hypothetical protein Tco_0108693 [Tanacetum coccineum]